MYIKLNEDLYKKIKGITCTEYDATGDFIPSESIEPMLEDLICEIERLEEKYEDLERELNENYELKNVNLYVEYGVSERDFF